MVEYAISTVAGIVFLYLLWKKPAWTGMRGKTLWNWIALLLVPTSVSFGTYLIGMAQQRAELENRREAAIQNYFDRISSLVLTENRGLDDVSLAIGRAHTAAILKQATGEAGGRIVLFLTEMGLLEVYVDSLEALDLSHSELKGIKLEGIEFEKADLSHADLEDGRFRGSDFEEADLTGTDFDGADLRDAEFDEALMKGTELAGADLRGADLSQSEGLAKRSIKRACVDSSTKLPPNFRKVVEPSPACLENRDIDTDD